jgi:hypothetical protein
MNEMNAQDEKNIINEVYSAEDATKSEIQKFRNDIKNPKNLILSK